jgi:hypothetical protein
MRVTGLSGEASATLQSEETAAPRDEFQLGPDEQLDADAPRSILEQRILTLLGLLGGAPLGADHIAAVSGVPDAEQRLVALERQGWVRSTGHRYRLVRSSSGVVATLLVGSLTAALLEYMIRFAHDDDTGDTLAGESDAIEATLGLAALDGSWSEAFELARTSEAKLVRAGAVRSARRVLQRGLQAARSLGDEHAEAYILHELGTLALCVGDTREAGVQLEEALAMRQRSGDMEGVAVTGHNIKQLGDGGPFWGGAVDPDPDVRVHGRYVREQGSLSIRWPSQPVVLAIFVLVIVCVVGLASQWR